MVTQKGSSSYSSSSLPSKGKEGSPGECSSPQWQWGRKYKIHPEDVIMAALDHQMPTWRVVEAPGAVVVSPQCRPLPLGSINAGTAAKSTLSPGRSKEEKPTSRTTSAPRKRGSVRGAAAKAIFTRSSTFAEVPCETESPSPLLAQQTSRTRNRGEVAAMVLKKMINFEKPAKVSRGENQDPQTRQAAHSCSESSRECIEWTEVAVEPDLEDECDTSPRLAYCRSNAAATGEKYLQPNICLM